MSTQHPDITDLDATQRVALQQLADAATKFREASTNLQTRLTRAGLDLAAGGRVGFFGTVLGSDANDLEAANTRINLLLDLMPRLDIPEHLIVRAVAGSDPLR